MDACETGRLEIVNALLSSGARYDLVDHDPCTALHWCAFRNRVNCVRVLLEKASQDPDIARFNHFLNQQSQKNGNSALHDVAGQGHVEPAKLILQYNPEYNSLDKKKQTPLHKALANGHVGIGRLLLDHAHEKGDKERFRKFVNARNESDETAWEIATRKNQNMIVDVLKASGVVGPKP